MKVSEITTTLLANYLRLDGPDATTLGELTVLLDIAKTYIKSYTGIQDISVTGEEVGTGDDIETGFYLANTNIISGSQDVYVNSVKKTVTTDYSIDGVKGKVTFISAPADGAEITAGYELGLDAYSDFVIVIYVLIQDMYDNRTLYVEKDKLNRVVETILSMHSTNLL